MNNDNQFQLKIEKLVQAGSFEQEVFRLIKDHGMSRKEAFNECNDYYQSVTGQDRYASFDSYRITRRKFQN